MGCTTRTEQGVDQWCWPDGEPYLEQANIVVEIFASVKDEIFGMIKEAKKNG